MESKFEKSELPRDVLQNIDVYCQEYEKEWQDGRIPELEKYISRISPVGRSKLLRELLILELNYRRGESGALTDSELYALHPQLASKIADELPLLRINADASSNSAETRLLPPSNPPSNRESDPTIDHQTPSRGSRGLHIRCPHCSNAVELLTDTPFESITCRSCGSAFSLVDQEDHTRAAPILKKIGRFELVARVGIGGFGTVWKARDTELDRTVAVKIPRKGQLEPGEIEQFFREARSAAQLRHPNIVPVHEVGRDEDTIFIVSDLIRGVSLADWLSGATPNSNEIAQLMETISHALHHAHMQGVIHRDLKPSNILLDDVGQPYIMDFGLAKREVGEITMTMEGNILGTPAYMSPEQAAGEGHWTDRRTDIYSMGVILFRMLTGELPFRGNAQMQIHQRLTVDPPDPRQLNKHLPRDMCTICLKCLERDPNRRYSNAKELAEEFGRYLRREPILSRPISRTERGLRWAKRKPALTTAIASIVFLAIAGPVAAVVFHHQQAQLRAKMEENDNLIKRRNSELAGLNKENTALRSQLDVWEAKSDPWSFWLWPPERDNPPRRHMAEELFKHSGAPLAKNLSKTKDKTLTAAQGYLGLGILAQATGTKPDAIKYFEQARNVLTALHHDQPKDYHLARALADSEMRLSSLIEDSNPEEAAKRLESARTIYRQLAERQRTAPLHQIDSMEAELTSALKTPPPKRDTHLNRVEELHKALANQWPVEPELVYRLACYLTRTEPILPAAIAMPSEETSGASPTNPPPITD